MLAVAALAAAVLSCGKNTQLSGRLHEGAGEEVVVKLLDVNRFQVLDTVKVDDNGNFSYALDMEEGKPSSFICSMESVRLPPCCCRRGIKCKWKRIPWAPIP